VLGSSLSKEMTNNGNKNTFMMNYAMLVIGCPIILSYQRARKMFPTILYKRGQLVPRIGERGPRSHFGEVLHAKPSAPGA